MSNYLLNIAGRNAANDNPSWTAAATMPVAAVREPQQEVFEQDEPVQQSSVFVNPIQNQAIEPQDIFKSHEMAVPGKFKVVSYMSRLTERNGEKPENNSNFHEPRQTGIEETGEWPKKNTLENKIVQEKTNLTRFTNKKVPQNIPKKTNTRSVIAQALKILPNQKNEQVESINAPATLMDSPVKSNVRDKIEWQPIMEGTRHIGPARLQPANKNPVHADKKHQPAPKLMIGKITVEILPPATTVPPKIITRVVQQNIKPGPSKSNNLIFGLGQM